MNKNILKARKLAHQAQDLTNALIELYQQQGGKFLYTLIAKSIRRANRRLDTWQRLMEE